MSSPSSNVRQTSFQERTDLTAFGAFYHQHPQMIFLILFLCQPHKSYDPCKRGQTPGGLLSPLKGFQKGAIASLEGISRPHTRDTTLPTNPRAIFTSTLQYFSRATQKYCKLEHSTLRWKSTNSYCFWKACMLHSWTIYVRCFISILQLIWVFAFTKWKLYETFSSN